MNHRIAAIGLCSLAMSTGLASTATALPASRFARPVTTTAKSTRIKTIRVPAALLTTVVSASLRGTKMRLHSFGPKRGKSWHQKNASYIKLPSRLGGKTYRFTIPEVVKDLDCGILCPDLGDAKLYVNRVNLNKLNVGWAKSAINVNLGFESQGREIKGMNTGRLNIVPDVQIDRAKATLRLVPTARKGKLSYRTIGNKDISFSAKIQATGGCKIPGFGRICNWIFGYKNRVVNLVEGQGRAVLNNSAIRGRIENAMQAKLKQSFGINRVVSVKPAGNVIIVRYQ